MKTIGADCGSFIIPGIIRENNAVYSSGLGDMISFEINFKIVCSELHKIDNIPIIKKWIMAMCFT